MNRAARRINLKEYRAAKEGEGAIIVEADSGDFTIPPAILWPDAAIKAFHANDILTMAEAILGADEYARWTAEGNSAALLLDIIKADVEDTSAGEG